MVLAVVVGGWYWRASAHKDPIYRTAAIERGDLVSTISATGTLEPEEVIDVGAQVEGLIVSFGRDSNGNQIDYRSPVEPDMVLARIDDTTYKADVDTASAELEQAKTAIFCQNYGQAAAVDFFGAQYGLPKAISGHQNYFLWGPRNYTGEIVIIVGESAEDVRDDFASVEVAATQYTPYALWYENQPILLCRGLKHNLQTIWPLVKNWR